MKVEEREMKATPTDIDGMNIIGIGRITAGDSVGVECEFETRCGPEILVLESHRLPEDDRVWVVFGDYLDSLREQNRQLKADLDEEKRLRRELKEIAHAGFGDMGAIADGEIREKRIYKAGAEALREQNRVLQEALEPFARLLGEIDGTAIAGDGTEENKFVPCSMRLSDLEAARAALEMVKE